MASEWVDLGRQTTVRRDEIVAVHNGCNEDEVALLAVRPWGGPKAIVVLRGSVLIPAYVSAQTVMRRIREAE